MKVEIIINRWKQNEIDLKPTYEEFEMTNKIIDFVSFPLVAS